MIYFTSNKFAVLGFISACPLQLPLAINSIEVYSNILIKMDEDKNWWTEGGRGLLFLTFHPEVKIISPSDFMFLFSLLWDDLFNVVIELIAFYYYLVSH